MWTRLQVGLSKLCVDKLGVSKLSVDKLCVEEAGREEGGGRGGSARECKTKNKNPTQRCGEKHTKKTL